MKKLIVIILLCCTHVAFGQTGVRVSLNNLVSVTFPAKPVISKPDSNTTVYSINRNGAFYTVTVEDLSKKAYLHNNVDSLLHFYDGLYKSQIKAQGGTLAYKKRMAINDDVAIEFAYTLNAKASVPDTRFQQSVYIDNTLVSFAFWTFKDKLKANAADKDIFFNSIVDPSEPAPPTPYQPEIKAPADSIAVKTPAPQTVSKATESRFGYSVGYLLGAAIFTAFIIGMLILIKRNSRKDKNE
ncbi:hypothetical protein BDD43_3173 [Mucilaginibacter gracilis]|uniref:LPXTG-motif cell wall-anchored protein n=1 Tax=Mucilaginibacter gracilis TaxID=423350 RepID=A0A495J3P0_9SPHI|nr:hypothetical protein [Mucilaginibacter gracilis]RKR82974.1 hypothetical protein BDD43_3173 [Mucilaginibacter gracilis]